MRPGAARPGEPCWELRESGLAQASVQRMRVGIRVPQRACGRAENICGGKWHAMASLRNCHSALGTLAKRAKSSEGLR